ncbi:MAG: tetratricopeptide repeat protein [Chloroflexota bacterium]
MAKNQDYAEQLGRAWALHRQGQNDAAAREFSALLQNAANNMDALYGLGLSQRGAGQMQAAQSSFEKCLVQVNSSLAERPNEDRFQMLEKMTNQRLSELKAK